MPCPLGERHRRSVQFSRFNEFVKHAGAHMVTRKRGFQGLFLWCGCHLMEASRSPISSGDWMDAGLWQSSDHTLLLTSVLMTSSILYFRATVANFSSWFRTSHHSWAKDTAEDYSSPLFLLIAAGKSVGELKAWREKSLARKEDPWFWFEVQR